VEVVYRIFWTDSAINQLKDIYDYYFLTASLKIAQQLVQNIIESTIILEKNPNVRRKEDLLVKRSQEFRFIVIKNYKIIYSIDTEFHIIYVSSVFDTRQNPKAIEKLTP
jgi:plasmid stabilization system protein ParE